MDKVAERKKHKTVLDIILRRVITIAIVVQIALVYNKIESINMV